MLLAFLRCVILIKIYKKNKIDGTKMNFELISDIIFL